MLITHLGSFECNSGKAVISDPCQENPQCMHDVKPGKWKASILTKKLFGWENNVLALIAVHEVVRIFTNYGWEKASEINVDSGQIGIFDLYSYRNDDIIKVIPRFWYEYPKEDQNEPGSLWYGACCDITFWSKKHAGIIPGGVVSKSGTGNGNYKCYVLKRNSEIVGIKIEFNEFEEE